jgi:uncharacterized membrane protein
MEALGILLVLLSVPLVLRRVPPNHFYGFRVPATHRDRSVWYDVNAAAGWEFIALGAVMVTLEFAMPRAALTQTLRPIAIVGLALIITVNWRLANRLERERRR